ncbi:MAG: response regulator [Candidatus Hydrogenedentes bacterium]|nr:response regulator [Candidatus Hydrogenedentota bacterium]
MAPRILIVDDEQIVVFTLERMLTRAGYQTESALSGREAEERLKEARFDVAIVDLFMPDINGFQLLEWMQANTPDVVPMVLSGTSSVLDALKAVEKGAFDFVSKPIENQEDFVQHIERAVEQ